MGDFFFEIINHYKVREEGQYILDFEKIRIFQESHSPSEMLLLERDENEHKETNDLISFLSWTT